MDVSLEKIEGFKAMMLSMPEINTQRYRRNLIDIAGYPSWENVNSNFLAYYLDNEEDHGFKDLFLRSLIQLCAESPCSTDDMIDLFVAGGGDGYDVTREFSTKSGGRIDIVVTSRNGEAEEPQDIPAAALVIENKIYAGLYNNLTDYLDSVHAQRKIGIVLCRKKIQDVPKSFIAVTHNDLVEKVKRNLYQYYDGADDRHLLFLKEYIANIKSMYRSPEEHKKMSELLNFFHNNQDQIKKFHNHEDRMAEYITRSVAKAMEANGFPPKATNRVSKKPKYQHYRATKESTIHAGVPDEDWQILKNFRFFINLDDLKYQPTLVAYFEIYKKENVGWGEPLLEKLKDSLPENDYVGIGAGYGNDYYHIYEIQIPVDTENTRNFEAVVQDQLEKHFFNSKAGYIPEAVKALKMIMNA